MWYCARSKSRQKIKRGKFEAEKNRVDNFGRTNFGWTFFRQKNLGDNVGRNVEAEKIGVENFVQKINN